MQRCDLCWIHQDFFFFFFLLCYLGYASDKLLYRFSSILNSSRNLLLSLFLGVCISNKNTVLSREQSADFLDYPLHRLYSICLFSSALLPYVPTLLFRTGSSRFQRTAPVLPFIPEIFHFEMILAWISDNYEFFKLITLFVNSMWKSWLLATKLGACVALGHHLYHEQ